MLNNILRAAFLLAWMALSACGGGGSSPAPNNGGAGSGSPPAAPTGVAAAASEAQVALTWNAVTGATGYYANRSTNAGGPYTRLSATSATAFTDTSLANGTTYYYVITAFNSSGTGAQSAEVNARPLQAGPIGLLAVRADASISLTWDVAAGAGSYNVKRALVSGGPYTTIATPTANSYIDTSVANATTYYYVASANRAGVESANSVEISVAPLAATPGTPAAVDFAAVRQVIRGFGGSSAWITDMTARPGMADRLFGNADSQQIGLSILRVRIDPSPDPGNHANWNTELSNAKLAIARGARVIATPWTPPASMKSNSDLNNGGSLNVDRYADYANYLQSFVDYMEDGGAPLYAISIQNEPDWQASYESCIWTGAQMRTWITDHASVLTTRVIMPESVNFTAGSFFALADPTLNDPAAAMHVDIVAGHLYGTSPTPYPNAAAKNKELWMTEHTVEATGMQGAMDLAREIHESMVVANYNAYIYWWLQNWIVGNNSPYVVGLINDPALNLDITKHGYAMGQFAKFIRPDFVRVETTGNLSTGVYVSAYKDVANSRFVIVAVNTGQAAIVQPFAIQNQTLAQFTPYRTSTTENIAQLGMVAVTAGSFNYTLPAMSVTTFVQ